MTRYDVIYNGDRVTIGPHFCREWDDDGGCYGTNPNHGYTLEEACEQVAVWHEGQASAWRDGSHYSIQFYKEQERRK